MHPILLANIMILCVNRFLFDNKNIVSTNVFSLIFRNIWIGILLECYFEGPCSFFSVILKLFLLIRFNMHQRKSCNF